MSADRLWAEEYGTLIDDVTELRGVAEQLSHDARLALLRIARRMLAGQKQYGALHLERDQRVWKDEIREELLDAVVYMEFLDIANANNGNQHG